MNIFNRVTLQTLKKNRTRTIVTIIGIILSTAMITAVTTFVSSLQHQLIISVENVTGSWHAMAYDVTDAELTQLKDHQEVKQVARYQNIGYAKIEGIQNEDKPYLFIAGFDTGLTDLLPVHISAGRMAQNSSELVIPAHLQDNGGVTIELGSQLTLDLGQRIANGQSYGQNMEYMDEEEDGTQETLQVTQTKTYTVVGIMERPEFEPRTAPGYTAVTIADPLDEGYSSTAYIQLNQLKDTEQFCAQIWQGKSYDVNSDLLLFTGNSSINNVNSVLYSLSAIIIVLIMVGSISLIYNAFSISVSERTKEFGLLSSVGATRRQLRKSVLFEALVVSGIGIPIGVLSGIGGIAVTLLFLGDSFSALMVGSESSQPMTVCVSIVSIIAAVLLALLTVLISAYIPSRRAMKVSAIEAIRQTTDVNIKPRKVKTPKWIYKLFRLEGMLADKNFKRNRKRYRTTVISLFISIVLFISASSFCAYLTMGIEDTFQNIDYDIAYHPRDNDQARDDEIYRLLSQTQGVNQSIRVSYVDFSFTYYPDEYLDERYKQDFGTLEGFNGRQFFTLTFLEDDDYRSYLQSLHLDPDEYMNPDRPQAVATAQINGYDSGSQRYVKYQMFNRDHLTLDILLDPHTQSEQSEEEERKDDTYDQYSLAIQIVDQLPMGLSERIDSGLCVVLPRSVASAVFGDINRYQLVNSFYFSVDNPQVTYERMKNTLIQHSFPYTWLNNLAQNYEINRSLILIINVFSYGFIILISLIAAANVFNTISTGIHLRRREFAMLRSVGMSARGFQKMMNYECLLYGFKALLYGLPVAILITYLIFRSIVTGLDAQFFVPWVSIVIAVLSVFLVVFLSMMYAMRKIKKQNTIDALKNENI